MCGRMTAESRSGLGDDPIVVDAEYCIYSKITDAIIFFNIFGGYEAKFLGQLLDWASYSWYVAGASCSATCRIVALKTAFSCILNYSGNTLVKYM